MLAIVICSPGKTDGDDNRLVFFNSPDIMIGMGMGNKQAVKSIYSAKNTPGVSLEMEALRCLCYNLMYEVQKAEPCSILHKVSHSDIDQIPKEGIKKKVWESI